MALRQVIFLSRSLTPHPHVHGVAAESELTAGSLAVPSLRVFSEQNEMFRKILIWNLGHASFYFEIVLNIKQCKKSNKNPYTLALPIINILTNLFYPFSPHPFQYRNPIKKESGANPDIMKTLGKGRMTMTTHNLHISPPPHPICPLPVKLEWL